MVLCQRFSQAVSVSSSSSRYLWNRATAASEGSRQAPFSLGRTKVNTGVRAYLAGGLGVND